VKAKIHEDLEIVHERLDAAKAKIRAHVVGGQNQGSLLTRGEQAYTNCLELQKEQLEVLLQEDEAHWRENLDKAKASRDLIQSQIQEMIESNQKKLQSIFNFQLSRPTAIAKYKLKKLPMWGWQAPAD